MGCLPVLSSATVTREIGEAWAGNPALTSHKRFRDKTYKRKLLTESVSRKLINCQTFFGSR